MIILTLSKLFHTLIYKKKIHVQEEVRRKRKNKKIEKKVERKKWKYKGGRMKTSLGLVDIARGARLRRLLLLTCFRPELVGPTVSVF